MICRKEAVRISSRLLSNRKIRGEIETQLIGNAVHCTTAWPPVKSKSPLRTARESILLERNQNVPAHIMMVLQSPAMYPLPQELHGNAPSTSTPSIQIQPARVYTIIVVTMQRSAVSGSPKMKDKTKRLGRKCRPSPQEHYTACSPFISVSSYSPLPSPRCRPRPRPRDGKNGSFSTSSVCGWNALEDDCAVPLPPAIPNVIGLSSRHWQAQIPRKVIRAALAHWRHHQSKLRGIERV